VKNLAGNGDGARGMNSAPRKWFSAMLWRAFPARSEAELSEVAARALGCSARQVKNWLRCENDASLSYVVQVLAIAGAEVVFQKMERG
jgi:hypothetical protein